MQENKENALDHPNLTLDQAQVKRFLRMPRTLLASLSTYLYRQHNSKKEKIYIHTHMYMCY
jgi:hypothetical protein